MTTQRFKQDLNDQFARLGKVLSNGRRLELLEHLAQGERSVDGLARVAGLSVANTSQHLQRMQQAGLVTARREGKQVIYAIAADDVVELLDVFRRVGERHLAEVRQMVDAHLHQKDALEPVSAEELIERCRKGLVTLIDVRPEEEYEAGHIPGAINVSVKDLERRMAELDPEREVIAYCRGPYCTFSFEAVARLREAGFQTRRLESGFPEWKLAGLPTSIDDTETEPRTSRVEP
ncbi:metalloregulator ArsR/SmtB family transcription factor [Guyparkeria hydrothermalis]|uniref:Metalloregulator ArsR/SmtB family transcription factor n=1 Tax=Guyparkeria halophila TaxID=47960 RepID=A0A6I6D5Y5_9GAMM|nr:metalloregulator ArsR/SmtB family transcription factor [Guyparkeria halophila]MCL7750567.1 metalloregulator ArsR/SmtB family transcription factor [Guyparkeria hydrothermalis]QGT79433.1 metalloregulator ArsR/SmtB family transcription factor [Guyparkeria halophila]